MTGASLMPFCSSVLDDEEPVFPEAFLENRGRPLDVYSLAEQRSVNYEGVELPVLTARAYILLFQFLNEVSIHML